LAERVFASGGVAVTNTTSPQAAVLAVLAGATRSLSTREVCDHINTDRPTPLVMERVYGALVALHRRGMVTRCTDVGRRRHVYWQLVAG
jgi:Fe2+ or Zn2+ uptake regulation protein